MRQWGRGGREEGGLGEPRRMTRGRESEGREGCDGAERGSESRDRQEVKGAVTQSRWKSLHPFHLEELQNVLSYFLFLAAVRPSQAFISRYLFIFFNLWLELELFPLYVLFHVS